MAQVDGSGTAPPKAKSPDSTNVRSMLQPKPESRLMMPSWTELKIENIDAVGDDFQPADVDQAKEQIGSVSV